MKVASKFVHDRSNAYVISEDDNIRYTHFLHHSTFNSKSTGELNLTRIEEFSNLQVIIFTLHSFKKPIDF